MARRVEGTLMGMSIDCMAVGFCSGLGLVLLLYVVPVVVLALCSRLSRLESSLLV